MKRLFLLVALMSLNAASAEPEMATPFPGAKKGINVWPLAKVNSMHPLVASAANGFIETEKTNQAVMWLLNLPKTAKQQVAASETITDEADTSLRSSISKLRLGFNFNGIPGVNKEDVLGYAVAGGWSSKDGWNGAGEFISVKDMGVCSFVTMKINSVILVKEMIIYAVNGKPTVKLILGNYTTGFDYEVNWYTNSRVYQMECANTKYDPKIIDRMIELAKGIDKTNR